MLINRQTLKTKANQRSLLKAESAFRLSESFKVFNHIDIYDIFLSHAFLDADEIEILKDELIKAGYSVYVDWIDDKQLSRESVDTYTATILRNRMRKCKSLIYAFSINSSNSKWMPWELGFFDGYNGSVSVLPITEKPAYTDEFKGVEYLGIYPYVTQTLNTFYVQESQNVWVGYNDWLKGEKPSKRNG